MKRISTTTGTQTTAFDAAAAVSRVKGFAHRWQPRYGNRPAGFGGLLPSAIALHSFAPQTPHQ